MDSLDITTIPDDCDTGYILEVDLEYPKTLHDNHSDYPLAPERMSISDEMLSPHSRELKSKLGVSSAVVEKLVPNLSNKTSYVLHYRNLKFYLSQGMQLAKIHRAISFTQSPWLKTYIDFNTTMRKNAKNATEKDFFKLMNNSVFGKTMENIRKRVTVELVSDVKRLKKLVAKPNYSRFKIFNEDLVAVHMQKVKLLLNKPHYVGFSVLDISKLLMYDFHYKHMKVIYGPNAKLLFTDTDSLCYEVTTPDVYADMQMHIDLYDTSDYPESHPLHSTKNKKALGKMKDETLGIVVSEFVGLRSKMYSLRKFDGKEKRAAKGVSKYVINNELKHTMYRECLLESKQIRSSMNQIRSQAHVNYSLTLNKIGLSPYDDKRYVLDNGYDTRAHGHYLNSP